MDVNGSRSCSPATQSDEEMDLRRGPWTDQEDLILINYVTTHGEGRWNSLARHAGLKRTGKSCRLRWLNYLRPDVRRGNITLQEQLLILELHSRWGNRWSKIAQQLPGRTDNEIKNYWRTRVQKQAKQLQCDVNSKQFKDTMRDLWIPRLVERIQAATASASASTNFTINNHLTAGAGGPVMSTGSNHNLGYVQVNPTFTPDNSSTGGSSDSLGTQISSVSDMATDNYSYPTTNTNGFQLGSTQVSYPDCLTSPISYFNHGLEVQAFEQNTTTTTTTNNNVWLGGGDASETLWNDEDTWFWERQPF